MKRNETHGVIGWAAAAGLAMACLTAGPAPAADTPRVESRMTAPRGVDMTGVWIGMPAKESPPTYHNTPYPSPPPFTAAGATWSAYWAQPSHNLGAQCIPWGGASGVVNAGFYFPLEIIQKDKQVTLINEYLSATRRIYTDGRGHPDDLEKTWLGHSIGHWEGDALVVDTIGGHAGPLNGSGATVLLLATDSEPRMPYSESMHLVERIRMLGGGKFLQDELTFTDPVIYTRPFTVKRYWRRAPELSVLEYVCTENQRPKDEGMPFAKEAPPAAH